MVSVHGPWSMRHLASGTFWWNNVFNDYWWWSWCGKNHCWRCRSRKDHCWSWAWDWDRDDSRCWSWIIFQNEQLLLLLLLFGWVTVNHGKDWYKDDELIHGQLIRFKLLRIVARFKKNELWLILDRIVTVFYTRNKSWFKSLLLVQINHLIQWEENIILKMFLNKINPL